MSDGDGFRDPLLGDEAPSGLQRTLRYRLAAWRPDAAELTLPVLPLHLNRAGVVHGGVLMTLIDAACGFAGTFCPDPGRVRPAVTLSLATSFLGQASGGTLRATAGRRGGGRRIFMAGCEVRGDDGRLIATGEGVYRFRKGGEDPDGVPLRPPGA